MKQDQDTELAVQEAQAWVRLRAPQITNSTPAIVLDIDETSLSNWRRIYQDEYLGAPPACYFKNERCTDRDWQWTAKAPAVQPVLELYNLAQCVRFGQPCSKVDVYFVTGRHEGGKYVPTELCANGQQDACQKLALTPREWTLENLKNAGFVNVTDDHLRMRSDSDGSVSDYKTGERRKIENNGQVTIIANVGDQQSDLVGLHAERTFKVPNPFYFIP
jgi:acid phosphatase